MIYKIKFSLNLELVEEGILIIVELHLTMIRKKYRFKSCFDLHFLFSFMKLKHTKNLVIARKK